MVPGERGSLVFRDSSFEIRDSLFVAASQHHRSPFPLDPARCPRWRRLSLIAGRIAKVP